MCSVRVEDLMDGLAERLGVLEIRGARGLGREIPHSGACLLCPEDGSDRLQPGAVLIVGRGDVFCPDGEGPGMPGVHGVSLVVYAEDALPGDTGLRVLEEKRIASCRTRLDRYAAMSRLKGLLSEKIDGRKSAHGVLVLVCGSGILLAGRSGAGKTECALELVKRGRRLVADDIIMLRRRGALIYGRSPAASRGMLHIRGTGLIDVRKQFGENAFRKECRVDLIVQLTDHPENAFPTGAERRREILGVMLPQLELPAGDSRLAALIEDAAVKHGRPGGKRNSRRGEL